LRFAFGAACTTKYVNERRAQAQKLGELAKAEGEADAGNATVKDLNDFYVLAKNLAQSGKKSSSN
jgi:hypothetical protein